MKYVVFDTNAYRGFVSNKSLEQVKRDINDLKNKEKESGITAVLNLTVLAELLKHLTNPNDVNYDQCKNALVAAVMHCTKWEGDNGGVVFMPEWENTMYTHITGKKLSSIEDNLYGLSLVHIAVEIANDPTDDTISKYKEVLEINKKSFAATKKNVFDALSNGIKLIDPGSTFNSFLRKDKRERSSFLSFLESDRFFYVQSLALIMNLMNKYNLGDVSHEVISNFSKKYRPLLQLYRRFYKKIVNGIMIRDETHKELNTVYDGFIMNSALFYTDVIFVSQETKLRESYKEAGQEFSAFSLEEYLQSFNTLNGMDKDGSA